MSNILTHSLSWKKQDIDQLFVVPAFLGSDITNLMEVITDVTGTYTLNYMSTPTDITKTAATTGFSGQGSMTLTNTDVTVAQVKAEWEENGKAFIDSIYSMALAQGYSLDDVENMTNPAFWNTIVLPKIAAVIQRDKVKHTWFAGTKKEVINN